MDIVLHTLKFIVGGALETLTTYIKPVVHALFPVSLLYSNIYYNEVLSTCLPSAYSLRNRLSHSDSAMAAKGGSGTNGTFPPSRA